MNFGRSKIYSNNIFLGLILSVLLSTNAIQAAPAPLTSSSHVMSLLQGIYKSKSGFLLNSQGTHWLADVNSDQSNLELIYRAPQDAHSQVQAALTVRVDHLDKALGLRTYVQRWLKDYPKFGFEVLGSKTFHHREGLGYVIDLKAPGPKKQLRQVIFVKDKMAVVLSCRDDESSFRTSLKTCNQIFRSFAWTE